MNGPSPIENIMTRRALPKVPENLKRLAGADNGAILSERTAKGRPLAPPQAELHKYFPGLANGAGPSRPAGAEAYRSGQVATGQVVRGPDIKREIAVDHERKKLYESAVEFQSLFVKMMLNSMRKTLNKENDPLYGGQTQEIFEDMLYDKHALSLSKNGGFPLADWVYRDLTRNLPPAGQGKGPTPTMERGGRQYEINLPAHSPGVSSGQIKTRPNGL